MLYTEALEVNLYITFFQKRFAVISFPATNRLLPFYHVNKEAPPSARTGYTQLQTATVGRKSARAVPGTGDERLDPDFHRIWAPRGERSKWYWIHNSFLYFNTK